jgi:hypothetical protein
MNTDEHGFFAIVKIQVEASSSFSFSSSSSKKIKADNAAKRARLDDSQTT